MDVECRLLLTLGWSASEALTEARIGQRWVDSSRQSTGIVCLVTRKAFPKAAIPLPASTAHSASRPTQHLSPILLNPRKRTIFHEPQEEPERQPLGHFVAVHFCRPA